jgi:predicted metal-binding membrane protein
MILMFVRVSAGKRQRGQVFVPTWMFVGSYLVVWTAFGALAYVGALAAQGLAAHSVWVMDNAAHLGGAVLILAGLYQLSPLKNLCLTKCRSPINFILNSWHDGYPGALRMGLAHGAYCLGCCWLLFVILFPIGVMNLAAMVVITLLIFAEKSLPMGREISRIAAVALVGYGGLVLVVPHLLPIMM